MPNTSPSAENLGFLTVISQPCGLIGGYLVLNQAGRPLEFHCTTPLKPNRTQEILYGNTLEPFFYGEQIAQTLLARSKVATSYVLTNVAAVLAVQELVKTPVFYVFETTGKKLFRPDPEDSQPNKQHSEQSTEQPIDVQAKEQAEMEQQAKAEQTAPVADLFPESKTAIEISEELNASLKLFGIENSHLSTKPSDEKTILRVPAVPGLNTERWKEVKIGNRLIAIPTEKTEEEAEHHQFVDDIKRISRIIDLAEPFTRIRLAIEETQRAA